MPFSLQGLKNEVTNDPKGRGYAAMSDSQIADDMNTPGASGDTITKAYTPLEDVVACIVRAEYDPLTAAAKTFLNEVVLKGVRVKTGDSNLRASLAGVFGAGATRTATPTASPPPW